LISIIICSRSGSLSPALKKNIEETIGIVHEIILIDNSDNRYSIFQAYNKGVEKSRFPYLCFMHDDIIYHTNNWGVKVVEHFADEKTGAIGISGTPYMPYLPGSWWCSKLVNINVLPANLQNEQLILHKYPPTSGNKNKVIVLDGVWFCIPKLLFKRVSFDEVNYTGFHFYDVDITMQVSQGGYDIFCVFDIAIQHFSKAYMNKTWQQNALAFNKKWQPALPAACIPLTYSERCGAELKTLREFTTVMIMNGLPAKKTYRIAFFRLLKYFKLYFYFKTPIHLSWYLFKSFV
jgi:glycosyltransferase involved in cell wall biosynthesis